MKKTDEMRVGFTLIELLVVISIIALLLAILMPALKKVKIKADLLISATNQRSLSLAMLAYANDNKSRLPDNTFSYMRKYTTNAAGAMPVNRGGDTAFVYSYATNTGYLSAGMSFIGLGRMWAGSYLGDWKVYNCPLIKGRMAELKRDVVLWNKDRPVFRVGTRSDPAPTSVSSYFYREPGCDVTSDKTGRYITVNRKTPETTLGSGSFVTITEDILNSPQSFRYGLNATYLDGSAVMFNGDQFWEIYGDFFARGGSETQLGKRSFTNWFITNYLDR